MRAWWIGLAIPVAGLAAQLPSRPLMIEDYYRIRTIGMAQISPDGDRVVFLVSTRVEDTGRETGEAWVVATDGSTAPRLVSGPGHDVQSVRWVGDGVEYLADRETFRVSPAGPSGPVVRAGRDRIFLDPTGRYQATIRETTVPRPAAVFGSDFERRHEERFRGTSFDWLEFQRDGAPFPVPDPRSPWADPAAEIWLTEAVAPNVGRPITALGLKPRDLTWSPTGGFLVFAADSGYRTERRYGRNDLWTVSVGGSVRHLTTDDGLEYRNPAVSPDGGRIAFVRSHGTDKVIRERLDHGGPTDLGVIPATGGPPVILTAEWDLIPGEPAWSGDGRHLYFPAAVGGERHLFRVAANGGPVEQVTTGARRLNSISFDRAMTRVAYLVGRREAPAELFVARLDGADERQLTRINDAALRGVSSSPSARLQFSSADGTPIEGWLTFPAGFRGDGARYPLIVSSHGGPHAASGYEYDFKTQYFAAQGYFVLETNFRSSTGYGEKFLWATWGAWGSNDGQDVMAGVDYVLGKYPIDRARVGATGHSYGGFMTNWLITQYPDRFAAAITGAGISNWVSDYGTADIARTKETEFYGTPWEEESRARMIRQSPLSYAGRVKTPTLFVHGEVDQRVPYEEAEQMYVALKKNGVPAKMIVYSGQAHAIRGPWNVVHRMLNERAWWDRWLKGSTP